MVELLLQADRGEEVLKIIQQWAADARRVSDLSGGHPDHRIQLLDALHSTGHLHRRLNLSILPESCVKSPLKWGSAGGGSGNRRLVWRTMLR